jgi:hypothetical protein
MYKIENPVSFLDPTYLKTQKQQELELQSIEEDLILSEK